MIANKSLRPTYRTHRIALKIWLSIWSKLNYVSSLEIGRPNGQTREQKSKSMDEMVELPEHRLPKYTLSTSRAAREVHVELDRMLSEGEQFGHCAVIQGDRLY